MIILLKKAVRDLMRNKLRTISMILAISLSVGLGIGLVNATRNAFDSFDKRLEVTNYEDIDIHFNMTSLDISEIENIDGVKTASGRTFIETQVAIGDKRFKTQWISSPYYPVKPYSLINGYQLTDGDYISGPLEMEALIGNIFADSNNIGPGDTLKVIYANKTFNLTVTGSVASPEYIYVVSDEGWPEPSLLLPLFTTYEITNDLLGLDNDTYNELLVTVENGHDASKVKEALETYLTGKGVRITTSLLGTMENDYLFSRTDAGAMGQMGWIFGTIILVVTAVVIYNSMTRLISTQRAYIGVMGALGGRMSDILIHYSLFGFFMGAAGALLGIPFGIGISKLTITEYASFIGMVDPVSDVNWEYVAAFSIIGISIATLGAFLGSLKAIRIGPREALTSQYSVQDFSKKPLLERLFNLIAYKRPILPRIPLRNLSRHKLRTGITLISLGVSLILVFSCLALTFGFTQPLQKNYDNYEKWDLKVTLIDPIPASQALNVIGSNEYRGTDAEISIDDYIPIEDGDKLSFARIQAFENGSSLRKFHLIEGNYKPERGILAGSILAKDLGITVGDTVVFVIGNMTSSAEVTGITGELMDDSFLMTLDQAWSIFGMGEFANSIVLNKAGMDKDQIETMVRDEFHVSSFIYTDDVINGMENMLQGLISMFLIFIAFGVIAEVLFVSTTVVLNILDREMEFISLRAIGVKPGRVMWMIMTETLILLVGGLLIGLPLGVITTKWAMAYMVKDLMYYVIEVGPGVYIVTAMIAVISALAASYISGRYIIKIKLVNAIRQRSG